MCSHPVHVPASEIEKRQSACRRICAEKQPEAGGLLVFSRLNIYYLTGTMAAGIFWLPLKGEPLLLCRRGEERARYESSLEKIMSYRSFREIPDLLAAAGAALTPVTAAEMNGLSWSLSELLRSRLPECIFVPADSLLARARSVKSPWELSRMTVAGTRHAAALQTLLPESVRPGMSEEDIAHRIWQIVFRQGHHGILRMQNYGEEMFLGHVSAGDSGNFPSAMDSPVGVRGLHPSVPFMGSPRVVWKKNQLLTVDIGFSFEGYQTDKTQVYWSGSRKSIPDGVRSAHDFCVDLQQRIAERMKPGSTPGELASYAFSRARSKGWAEGFMGLAGNKVRFIGHGIGLSIDEYPPISEGFDDPLEASMVLALEPKIGLPGVGMVGVENTFHVTPAGGRCLTGDRYDIVTVEPTALEKPSS